MPSNLKRFTLSINSFPIRRYKKQRLKFQNHLKFTCLVFELYFGFPRCLFRTLFCDDGCDDGFCDVMMVIVMVVVVKCNDVGDDSDDEGDVRDDDNGICDILLTICSIQFVFGQSHFVC